MGLSGSLTDGGRREKEARMIKKKERRKIHGSEGLSIPGS